MHRRFGIRQLTLGVSANQKRSIADAVPWQDKSKLPGPDAPIWEEFGRRIIAHAQNCDTGPQAFAECIAAREQLEVITREATGRELNVAVFGGIVINGIVEAGGDVDFVGVLDVEPKFEEQSEMSNLLSRELRRLGFRASSVPRARVPLVKVDRVSKSLPGTPLHSLSSTGIFQFSRPTELEEQRAFESHAQEEYGCLSVEWNQTHQFATVKFQNTTDLIRAITSIKQVGSVDIPLRLPIEPKHGPELYRYPFDLCMMSQGLQNGHLISRYFSNWCYSRHMHLFLKKWAKGTGMLNSLEGLLASYCLTVMTTHFLVHVGAIPRLDLAEMRDPTQLPVYPEYRPLEGDTAGDVAKLGYLTAQYFEYFGNVFNYENDVACTTHKVSNKQHWNWDQASMFPSKPPFFNFCVKDPYTKDNIARNLDRPSMLYVRESHVKAIDLMRHECQEDISFVADSLLNDAPKPTSKEALEAAGAKKAYKNVDLTTADVSSGVDSSQQGEARVMLQKLAFHNRKKKIEKFGTATVKQNAQVRAAQDLTRNIVEWIRSADNKL